VDQEQRGAQEGISHISSPKHIQVVLVLFRTPRNFISVKPMTYKPIKQFQ
jgi:hypothetical protein